MSRFFFLPEISATIILIEETKSISREGEASQLLRKKKKVTRVLRKTRDLTRHMQRKDCAKWGKVAAAKIFWKCLEE